MEIEVKGILFDFDGVLVDSMPIHLACWKLAYQLVFEQELDQSVLDQQVGKSTKFIAKHLADFACKPFLATSLANQKSALLEEHNRPVPLLPGTKVVLNSLYQNQIPFGIVSNASRKFIENVLQQHSLKVPFIHSIEDYSKPKPHPQPYLLGAKSLKLEFTDFRNILVFEDSRHGLKAAALATMYCIGICTQHSDTVLKSAGAKITYDSLAEAAKDHWFRF